MGGRGKHNFLFLGGAFRKAKYEIRRRRKARAGKNFYPQPPSFLPARAFGLAREARRQFRSKKVRISSNKRTPNQNPDFRFRIRFGVPSPGFEPGNRRPKRRVISVSPREPAYID